MPPCQPPRPVPFSIAWRSPANSLGSIVDIVQTNTMSTIEPNEFAGLRQAIENGTGLGGWHGGIADSYRNSADYLQLIGGQFAAHPGKHPQERTGSSRTTTCAIRSTCCLLLPLI